jgi:hypothetical protein
MATQQEVEQALVFLEEAYDKRYAQGRRAIFVALLQPIPQPLLESAVLHCISTLTFLPQVSEILKAVTSLQKMQARVPTPDEAWEDMLNATKPRTVRQLCTIANELYILIETGDPAEYMNNINQLNRHERTCTQCQSTTMRYQFIHPVVEQVATRLGWPDRFWSGEIGVDRGRFIKTYEAHIAHLSQQAALLPSVRAYVETKAHPLIEDQRMMLEDRSMVFDTREGAEEKMRQLIHSMEK